jgi:choice-of-anchor A domain-containing protein
MSKMRTRLFLLSATVGLLTLQPIAHAGVLGVAEGYNAFIFGNMSVQDSDTEGAVAVGGNATYTSYSIAQSLGNSGTNLVVGGNLNFSNGTIYGNTVVGGSATISSASTGSVTSHVSTPTLPINFSAAQTNLTQTSTYLNGLSNTGSYVDAWGSLTFTGSNDGLNVFSIAASTLDSSYGITINIPSDAFAIVNVIGSTSVSLPNVGFNFNSTDVLWNLSGVTTLSMASFNGSILAPSANVSFNNGALNGTLVANCLTGSGQLNDVLFNHTVSQPNLGPSTSTVPLPASVEGGLVLLSGMGIVGAYRRWRKVLS